MRHSSPVASFSRSNSKSSIRPQTGPEAHAGPRVGSQRIHPPVFAASLDVLVSVFQSQQLADQALDQVFKVHRRLGSRDRRNAADWAYAVIRWLHRLQAGLGLELTTSPSEINLRQLLTDYIQNGVPLESANWPRWVKSSYPEWLDRLCSDDLGDERWTHYAHELNQSAPGFLRANTLKCNASELKSRLQTEIGIDAIQLSQSSLPSALMLDDRKNLFKSAAFQDGWFEMQDGSSQTACQWVAAEPGQCVIDACAGAGGKTLAIAADMKNKGQLIAMDVSEHRLKEARRRATRAGVSNLETRLIEGSKSIKRLKERADVVLLDVPCTGLGVLRRNPDRKWKIKPDELARLTGIQTEILTSYSDMVKPGGRLVYATCSILKAENETQIERFVAERGSDFKLLRARRIHPGENGWDGFFVAEFQRRS